MSRIAENLDWSMRYFASDPTGSMGTLEQMYRENRIALLGEAVRTLSNSTENPGSIGVIAFLVKKRELLPLLRQVETPLGSRVRVAQLGQRVDPNLDQGIADQILNDFGPGERQDLLEILSQTRVRLEVITRLAPVLQDPNPRVHSKMAFLMARVAPEGEWVTEGMADSDPRVRANVVEALWNQKGEFANRLFHQASADAHHRVSANAIYGLYLQGDPAALGKIRHLLLGNDGLARRAGLWLVERTKDPRYLSMLGKLIGKVEPEARARCLRVIQAAKVRKAEALQRGAIRIDWLPCHPGQARLTISSEPKHRRLTGLHAFDIVIQAGGQILDDYRLVARPATPARAVVLMVGQCPDWKTAWRDALPLGPGAFNGTAAAPGPAVDRFGFLHVEPASERQEPEPQERVAPATAAVRLLGVEVVSVKPEAPPLAAPAAAAITWCGSTVPALRRTFEGLPKAIAAWPEAMRLVASQLDDQLGQRHVVLLDQLGAFSHQDVQALADLPKGLTLDVISGAPHPALAARCEENGGRYHLVGTAEDGGQCLGELHRYWQADYELTYSATAAIDGIEVCCEWGYGATSLRGNK